MHRGYGLTKSLTSKLPTVLVPILSVRVTLVEPFVLASCENGPPEAPTTSRPVVGVIATVSPEAPPEATFQYSIVNGPSVAGL
jgi:hypothetical protein